MSASRPAVAVDLGGTKVAVVSARDVGTVLRAPTAVQQAPAGIVDQIAGMVAALEPPGRLCIASAGALDVRTGTVVRAAQLPFKDFPLAPRLASACGSPVALLSDTVAAALAELTPPDRRTPGGSMYLTVSTGVGACVMHDGVIDWSRTAWPGEFGHEPVAGRMDHCGCGRQGCLELYASGAGLRRRYVAAGGTATIVHASTLTKLAHAGDTVAEAVLADGFDVLSAALTQLAREALIELIVVGGGLAAHTDLVARLSRALSPATVEPARFEGAAPLLGALRVCDDDRAVARALGEEVVVWHAP